MLDYLLAVVDGKPGVLAWLTRGVLRVLSWLYAFGLEVDLLTYPLGLARVTRLPARVVGVGNLSMGGTGKTLAVQRLVREAQAAGQRVAVLSRGYRRKSTDAVGVVATPEGICLSARAAGDEPFLLASSLPGVPVLVGKNRRLTGWHAVEHFGTQLLVLDDSFQYWRLHKDHEIVLLDALQPATRDHVLPRGFLREPWGHLRRAHEVWITHAELAPPSRVRALAARVRRTAPHAALHFTEHKPLQLRAPDGATAPLALLQDHPVLALSSLGNPSQFEAMLAGLGAVVTPCRYPDHHPYDDADVAAIAAAVPAGALVVTTAKDAVRLPAAPPFPLWIVDVELAEVAEPEG